MTPQSVALTLENHHVIAWSLKRKSRCRDKGIRFISVPAAQFEAAMLDDNVAHRAIFGEHLVFVIDNRMIDLITCGGFHCVEIELSRLGVFQDPAQELIAVFSSEIMEHPKSA